MYQKLTITHPLYGDQLCIIRLIDGAHISSDTSHPDWVAYQEWLAEGNTPEEWNPEQQDATDNS
jgi:hypothetical protein